MKRYLKIEKWKVNLVKEGIEESCGSEDKEF